MARIVSVFTTLRATIATAILTLGTTTIEAREQVYQENGYTIYFEQAQSCSLFYDSPAGSMTYFGVQGVLAGGSFNYARQGVPVVPGENSPVDRRARAIFEFNGNASDRLSYSVTGIRLSNGATGFGFFADDALRQRWASARVVRLLLATGGSETPIETISLAGSSEAMLFATACSRAFTLAQVPTPTVMPAPPADDGNSGAPPPPPPALGAVAMSAYGDHIYGEDNVGRIRTPRGVLEARCVGMDADGIGHIQVSLSGRNLLTAGGCSEYGSIGFSQWAQFADSTLIVTAAGTGMKEGIIIRIAPNGGISHVHIDYMDEFSSIDAQDRVTVAMSGVQTSMQTRYWSDQVRIDWASQRLIE